MKMKRILCVGLIIGLMLSLLAGCGGNDRILYKEADLSELVKLGDYMGIEIDTDSDEFKESYDDVVASDIENNQFYTTEEVTEGTIAEGDTVNIDYEGKKDGVAFEGGTAQGYDLEIGSGSFIPGFEDGLIGKTIGETVDLDLTFPENYSSAPELAGQAVVFTVKINSAQKRTDMEPKEFFGDLGYASVGEYEKATRKTAAENLMVQKIVDASEIKEYPQTDIDIIYAAAKNAMEYTLTNNYGMDFASYLSQIGMTEAEFKKEIVTEQIKPSMEVQMVLYAILDKEGIEFTAEEMDAEVDDIVNSVTASGSTVTADDVKEAYGDYYFEEIVVTKKVMDFLYENAKIK